MKPMENNCLLCYQAFKQELSILDILLFKNKNTFLCPACRKTFQKIDTNSCPTCHKMGTKEKCSDCHKWLEKDFKVQHKAIYVYNDKMKDYFLKYKFQGDYQLRYIFSKALKKMIKKDYRDYAILPVPISQDRLKERGFNQVEEILKAEKVRFEQILLKHEAERHSSLSKKDRETSQNPFYLMPNKAIPEKVLIVDDIYTTGTTIYHIYSLLKKAGCRKIKSVSIAR